MKLTKALTFLVCILFCKEMGMAQTVTPHSIKGAVITSDGMVVPQFTVVVRPVANKPELIHRQRFKGGEFEIDGLNRDKYQLEIVSKLYVTARIELNFTSEMRPTDFRIVILHTYRTEAQFTPGEQPFAVSTGPAQQIPATAKEAYMKGVGLHREGRLGEALVAYSEAIRTYPRYVEALSDMGAIYMLYNHNDAAMLFFRRAQQVDSGNATVRLNMALALMGKRQYDEAVTILQSMLAVEPENSSILYQIARARYAQKKYDLADRSIRGALDAEPRYLEAWLLFINIAKDRNDTLAARDGLVHLREVMNNAVLSKLVDEQLAMLGSE